MDVTNKRQVSVSIKDFKTIIPYLEEHFNITYAVLANVGFAIYENKSKNITPFQVFNLESLDDEDRLCFFIYNDREYPILDTRDDISQENFSLLIQIVWLIEYIYTATLEYKATVAKGYSKEYIEEMQDIIDSIDYSEYIRPDMLKLFNFVNDWKKIPQNEKVIIKSGAKTLELNNHRNWIFTAINNYLEEHLRVSTVEQAKEELQTDYSKKTGRKIVNRYQSAVIYGISAIYQQFTNNASVSNQLCRYIRDYLKYLEMPITDDDFEHNDQLSLIKAKIYEFRKKGGAPNWLENTEPEDFKRRSLIATW